MFWDRVLGSEFAHRACEVINPTKERGPKTLYELLLYEGGEERYNLKFFKKKIKIFFVKNNYAKFIILKNRR